MKGTLVLLFVSFFAASLKADPVVIELRAGKYNRPIGTIVSAEVEGIPSGAKAVLLEPGGGIGQVSSGETTRVYWLLNQALEAGDTIRYSLSPLKAQGGMGCLEDEDAIELQQSGERILRFVKRPTAEADSHESFYSRSGYIHPLWSPLGKVVTGDYPEDHVHQHALFFAWTKTTFEGRETEFWNQKLEKGKVSFQSAADTTGGVAFCGFSATNLYEDSTAPGGPKPVLTEDWRVKAWQSAPSQSHRIVDIEINQYCVGESPLIIEKYHYGGMAIRGNSQWLPASKNDEPPAGFLTSEGLSRKEGNHSQPDWVSMAGPVDGSAAGVSIMAHPSNFRHPQHVRLHPSKPYFVFAPMVENSFKIEPGKPYRAKFRIVIEDQGPDPEKLDSIYRQFAEPLQAIQIRKNKESL